MVRIYLSRRNLFTLLSKLDRALDGEQTLCTIIKQDTTHAKFPCSDVAIVTAVEDEEYYSDRPAGEMFPADEVKL